MITWHRWVSWWLRLMNMPVCSTMNCYCQLQMEIILFSGLVLVDRDWAMFGSLCAPLILLLGHCLLRFSAYMVDNYVASSGIYLSSWDILALPFADAGYYLVDVSVHTSSLSCLWSAEYGPWICLQVLPHNICVRGQAMLKIPTVLIINKCHNSLFGRSVLV